MKNLFAFFVFSVLSVSNVFASVIIPDDFPVYDLLISDQFDGEASHYTTTFGSPTEVGGKLILHSDAIKNGYEQVQYWMRDYDYSAYRIEYSAAAVGINVATIQNHASVYIDTPYANGLNFVGGKAYYHNYVNGLSLVDSQFYDYVIDIDLISSTYFASIDGIGVLSGALGDNDYFRSIRFGVQGFYTGGLQSLIIDDLNIYGVTVSEPSSIALILISLITLVIMRKKMEKGNE